MGILEYQERGDGGHFCMPSQHRMCVYKITSDTPSYAGGLSTSQRHLNLPNENDPGQTMPTGINLVPPRQVSQQAHQRTFRGLWKPWRGSPDMRGLTGYWREPTRSVTTQHNRSEIIKNALGPGDVTLPTRTRSARLR